MLEHSALRAREVPLRNIKHIAKLHVNPDGFVTQMQQLQALSSKICTYWCRDFYLRYATPSVNIKRWKVHPRNYLLAVNLIVVVIPVV